MPVLRFVAIPAALTDTSDLAPPPWPQREGDLLLWGDLEARLLALEGDGTPENLGILGSCVARLAEIERISGQVATGESP